jgi:glutamate dehydrogenase (NADP+)
MDNIYAQAKGCAEKYGCKGNLLAGANMAGFAKIAEAMHAQGWV